MNGDGCGTVFWGKKGNQVPGRNFVQLGCWGEEGEECLRFYDYDHDGTVGRCWIFRFSN